MFMYKVRFRVFPDIFGEMFVRNYDIHGYNTRQSDAYHVPIWRLEMVRRSIRIQGVHYGNQILDKINCYVTFVTFRYYVKNFLITNELE